MPIADTIAKSFIRKKASLNRRHTIEKKHRSQRKRSVKCKHFQHVRRISRLVMANTAGNHTHIISSPHRKRRRMVGLEPTPARQNNPVCSHYTTCSDLFALRLHATLFLSAWKACPKLTTRRVYHNNKIMSTRIFKYSVNKISVLFSYFSRVKYFVKRMAKNHKSTKIA